MKKFFDIRARGVRAASGALLYEIREYDKIGYIDAQEFARRPNDAIANLAACELTFVGNTLVEAAPHIASMSRRLQSKPALARLNKASIKEQGDAYCGGEIEKSLRRVAVKQWLRRNSVWHRF